MKHELEVKRRSGLVMTRGGVRNTTETGANRSLSHSHRSGASALQQFGHKYIHRDSTRRALATLSANRSFTLHFCRVILKLFPFLQAFIVTSDGEKVFKWIEEYFLSEAHEGRHLFSYDVHLPDLFVFALFAFRAHDASR